MLRNITAALPGIAFQLALEAVSPLLGGLTKWAKGLETWINNARINSCETAKAIVSSAAEAVGYSSQETCSDLAMEMGLESDRDAALLRAWCVGQGGVVELRCDRHMAVGTVRDYVVVVLGQGVAQASEERDPCRRERLSLCRAVLQALEPATGGGNTNE